MSNPTGNTGTTSSGPAEGDACDAAQVPTPVETPSQDNPEPQIQPVSRAPEVLGAPRVTRGRGALRPAPPLRKRGGRPAGRIWEFVDGDRKTSHVFLKCCVGMRVSSNATLIKSHVRGCKNFKKKFPSAVSFFDDSNPTTQHSVERHDSAQAAMLTTGPLDAVLNTTQTSKQSEIREYYKTVTSQMADNFDALYTDALLHDALPFNALSSKRWKKFFYAIFHGAWNPPGRNVITSKWLPEAKEKSDDDVTRSLRLMPYLCASADGWSDVNGRPVIHLLMGGVIPFVVGALTMGTQRETSVNLDKVLSKGISDSMQSFIGTTISTGDKPLMSFVSDSPNVMVLARKMLCGEVQGGSNVACFGTGCACHGLSLVIKDSFRHRKAAEVLKLGTKLAHYFKNVHLAGELLEEERKKIVPRSVSIKTFSKTRWGGAAYMFKSLLANKSQMGAVFNNDKMRTNAQKLLDTLTNENAKLAQQTTEDGEFWGNLENLTPFMELQLAVTTYLEGDLTPLSGVIVGYAYIYRASDKLETSGFATLSNFIKRQLKKRLAMIWSPVHALAVVLDPAILPSEWTLFSGLLGPGKLADDSRRALARMSTFLNYSTEELARATRALNARLSDYLQLNKHSLCYHPVVWWKQDGAVLANALAPFGMAVFSIFPSSAGPERSFKSRSRVITTVRNRLSKEHADMQCGLMFNGTQASRVLEDHVLAMPRESKMWNLMLDRAPGSDAPDSQQRPQPEGESVQVSEPDTAAPLFQDPPCDSSGQLLPTEESAILSGAVPEYEEPPVDECLLTQLGGGEQLDLNLNQAWGELDNSDQEYVDGQELESEALF